MNDFIKSYLAKQQDSSIVLNQNPLTTLASTAPDAAYDLMQQEMDLRRERLCGAIQSMNKRHETLQKTVGDMASVAKTRILAKPNSNFIKVEIDVTIKGTGFCSKGDRIKGSLTVTSW
jgi:hypothetical protein